MGVYRISSGKYRAQVMTKGKRYSKYFDKEADAVAWVEYYKKHKRALSSLDEAALGSFRSSFTDKTGKIRNIEVLDELAEIDSMRGTEFEEYCAFLLSSSGLFPFATYSDTRKTGDYGADIVITLSYGLKISVQCKRLKKSPVHIDAIQEVVASKACYRTDECIIMTNSNFTSNAQELAFRNDVFTIDREKLKKLIEIKNENMKSTVKKTQWKDFIKKLN